MSNVLIKLGTLNAYEHVPNVTANTIGSVPYTAAALSKSKLPVLIMLPGKGEIGTDSSKLLINGPSYFIQNGWNPLDWIIVSVQPTAEWANPAYVDAIVNNVIARYAAISDGRLMMTGLSAGGYAINNYIGQSAANSAKVTAVVTMSAPTPETYFNPAFFTQPAWGFCGTADSWYLKMKQLYTETLSKKFTSYSGGHGGWNALYDPAYKEDGKNIYDFLSSVGATVVTPPATTPAKEVQILADASGTVYASAKTLNILPGDTIVLKGNYQSFYLKDVVGTEDKPITVVADGKVKIGGYQAYGLIFENSSYFNVVGTSDRGTVLIDGGTTGNKAPGIALNKCHHLTVKGTEITNVSVGFMAKTTPKDETPGTYESATDTFAYDTITFEGNYIHDITGEGTYIGCSTSTLMPVSIGGVVTQVYAYRVKNVKVINNIFLNTGWDGIQLTCGDNVLISGNIITNYGLALVGYQGFGIICAGNNATITHNTVKNGTSTGITGSFNGVCEIAYNDVISAYGEGQDAIYANAHAIKDYAKFQPNIHNNYIEHCKRNAIRVANTDGFETPGVIKDNSYKDSLGVVDESGSVLTNNTEIKDPTTPTEPPTTTCPYPVSVLMSDGTSKAVAK